MSLYFFSLFLFSFFWNPIDIWLIGRDLQEEFFFLYCWIDQRRIGAKKNEVERDVEWKSFKLQILTFCRLLGILPIHWLVLQMLCTYLEERNRIYYLELVHVSFSYLYWVLLFFVNFMGYNDWLVSGNLTHKESTERISFEQKREFLWYRVGQPIWVLVLTTIRC